MRGAIIALLLSAGQEPQAPGWLVEARQCVAVVARSSAGRPSLQLLNELVEAEERVRATPPPTVAELRQLLEDGSPDRAAALAGMALHAVRADDLVKQVAHRYRHKAPLPERYYGAKVLGSMTAEQVARHTDDLRRVVREEEWALVGLAPAIRKMEPASMIALLADVAVAGSPVVAYLTARDAGDAIVQGLKERLQVRGADCPLYAVRNVEFMMGQKGWPPEVLEPPTGCPRVGP